MIVMVSLHRQQIIDREGELFPSKTYKELVLEPAYNQAKVNFVVPMLQIHFAHLIMLVEEGIVKKTVASEILKALEKINAKEFEKRNYDQSYEDLFFEIEDFIIKEA